MVFEGYEVMEVLGEMGVRPDLQLASTRENTKLDFIHRSLPDAEIFFVVNRWAWDSIQDYRYRYIPESPNRYDTVELVLRQAYGVPEVWNPMTGEVEEIRDFEIRDGRMRIPMVFGPEESKFIVIPYPTRDSEDDRSTTGSERSNTGTFARSSDEEHPLPAELPDIDLSAAVWTLQFDPAWGPAEPIRLKELRSWTQFEDPEIRYYSGSATYSTTIELPDHRSGWLYTLDLGNVQELCQVRINGRDAGTWWFPPFRGEIGNLLRSGGNQLEVTVYNLWPNRLIGDGRLEAEQRRTRTNVSKFNGEDAEKHMRVSGLIGPVRLTVSYNPD